MRYLEKYLSSINNKELVSSISETSSAFISNLNEHFRLSNQLNALLLGNVQSGKTGQMLGIIASMADKGYKIFLLLTTDNIDLHRQTYKRVKESLPDFTVLNEKEDSFLTDSTLIRPTIVVLKKNSSVLSRWKNHLLNTEICKGLILTIFDDEADNASLNTLVNKNRVSTINKRLSEIKATASNTIYVEVTGTPQAILLQTQISQWKPDFVYYFSPGSSYLGGKYFYPKAKSLTTIFTPNFELDDVKNGGDVICPIGLSESIFSFLVNCAHKKLNGLTNCNFMIHPSIRISVHKQFVAVVQDHLTLLQKSSDEEAFRYNLKKQWANLQQTKPDLEPFEDILETIIKLLDDTEISIIPLNSKSFVCRDPNNPDALDLSKGFNIIVGGNTLGRGLTFPNLQTVYYCRTSKHPQADTFWQHSRIFGYDREKELVRIFIPEPLYNLFAELNVSNEILIQQIQDNAEKIQLVYSSNIAPSRKNVIDDHHLNLVQGGVNIFSSTPIAINVNTINEAVRGYIGEQFSECDSDYIIKLLNLTKSENEQDFNVNKFVSCIKALKAKRPKIKCKLIVRVDRSIGKNTGTLLSPNDRILGDRFEDDIVLTMYRINGETEKGWDGYPLWIPNIKFPNNFFFYDID